MSKTTSAPGANGKVPRKTLASQLDRLDGVIDALAEGLNEAVATAVEQATGPALAGLLQKVLTDPAVLAKLRAALAPPAPPKTEGGMAGGVKGAWCRARGAAGVVCPALAARARGLWSWCVGGAAGVASGLYAAWLVLRVVCLLLWSYRRRVAVASCVGLAAGLGCYWAGPLFSASVCGLAAASLTPLAALLNPVRRPIPSGALAATRAPAG